MCVTFKNEYHETGPQGSDLSLDPELAIVFRGKSVSGHPGARGGPKNHESRPESFVMCYWTCSKEVYVYVVCFTNLPSALNSWLPK